MHSAMLLHVFALVACILLAPANATPTPTGTLVARNASPVQPRHSPSPWPVVEARSPTSPGLRKRDGSTQRVVSNEALVSHYLCPQPMRVCSLSPTSHPTTVEEWIHEGFECVNDHEDLTSCGGCGLSDPVYDCTAIKGALGVSCVVGACRVDSCLRGYTLALDGTSCVKTH